jgi:hypothetical protein
VQSKLPLHVVIAFHHAVNNSNLCKRNVLILAIGVHRVAFAHLAKQMWKSWMFERWKHESSCRRRQPPWHPTDHKVIIRCSLVRSGGFELRTEGLLSMIKTEAEVLMGCLEPWGVGELPQSFSENSRKAHSLVCFLIYTTRFPAATICVQEVSAPQLLSCRWIYENTLRNFNSECSGA